MTSDPLSDPLIKAAPATFEMASLVSALAGSYGLAGSLEPLAGERDRNLKLIAEDGATYLVKLAHPAEDVAITDFQTAALLHFEAGGAGLPVPRVIRTLEGEVLRPFDCGDAGVSQLRVLSFLPGEPMARLEVGRAQYRSFGGFAARLVEALSGFSHPADCRRLLWDIREVSCFRRLLPMIEDAGQRVLVSDVLDRFEREVTPALGELPTQVIHNDLNPHNVLLASEDQTRFGGVIDFGDMLRAPRVQEVATACSYLVRSGDGEPLADPAAFIAGFSEHLPLTAAERRVLPVMMAMRMAITVAITSWRAQRQPENATYIRRNVPVSLAGLAVLVGQDERSTQQALGLNEV